MSSSKSPSARFVYTAQDSGFSICASFNLFRKFVTLARWWRDKIWKNPIAVASEKSLM